MAVAQGEFDKLKKRDRDKAAKIRDLEEELEELENGGQLSFGRVAKQGGYVLASYAGAIVGGAVFDDEIGGVVPVKTVVNTLGAAADIGSLFVTPGGWGGMALQPFRSAGHGAVSIRTNRARMK